MHINSINIVERMEPRDIQMLLAINLMLLS
jgi:hypothetical protein